jgi:hypothetical protein
MPAKKGIYLFFLGTLHNCVRFVSATGIYNRIPMLK